VAERRPAPSHASGLPHRAQAAYRLGMTSIHQPRPGTPDAAIEHEIERALEEAGLRAGGSAESTASVGDAGHGAAVDVGDVAGSHDD
jgi:hypothetical protein